MPSLSIRKIDQEVYDRLRERAAENGVSIEEEVRRLIARSVSAPKKLGDLAIELFGPNHGVELDLPERSVGRPSDLET